MIKRADIRADASVFKQIIRIHKEEITEGFLSTFSDRFLFRLYRCIANSPYTFLFFAVKDDQVVGFIAGSINTKHFYRYFLLHEGYKVFFSILKKSLKIKNFIKIFETLFYPRKSIGGNLSNSEILNFCVSHLFQRKNIGNELFTSLVEEFRNRGVDQIKIATGVDQLKAQAFYKRQGAKQYCKIAVHKGHDSLVFLYSID